MSLTIAQRREKELANLVSFKTDNPTEADFSEARTLMNSFYRLCGLCERNLYLTNDERFCDRQSTKDSEEKEERWVKRLNKSFKEIYGLSLVYCGYCPSIGITNERGGFAEKVRTYFYE